jgi:hypothetical protein
MLLINNEKIGYFCRYVVKTSFAPSYVLLTAGESCEWNIKLPKLHLAVKPTAFN